MSPESAMLELLQRALHATRAMHEALERDDLEACERLATARQQLLERLPRPLPPAPPPDLTLLLEELRASDAALLARMRDLVQVLGGQLATLRARRALPYEPEHATSELMDHRS